MSTCNDKTRSLVKPSKNPKPASRVEIGEVVVCKMKGFCEWPAIVTGVDGRMVSVEFFGDHTTHRAAINNFFKFAECGDMIRSNLVKQKKPLYHKSIREAELVLGVPQEICISNMYSKKS